MSSDSGLNFFGQIGLASLVTIGVNTAAHPLCTAKNRLMANQPIFPPYKGIRFGVRSIYSGFYTICATESIQYITSYVANDRLRRVCHDPYVCAMLAGLIAAAPCAFGEGIMVNQQIHNYTVFQSMRRALQMSGLAATILRDVPYTLAIFGGAPAIERRLALKNENARQIVAGTIAGMIVGAVTSPFDTIKTRIQAEELSFTSASKLFVQEIMKGSGMRNYLQASAIRVAYIGLSVAIANWMNHQIPPLFPSHLHDTNKALHSKFKA